MREILFRGKDIDGICWHFGDLEHNGNRVPKWVCGCEVVPETVGQYTGLTDNNGVKIFEGDIVRCVDDINECEFEAVVVFGNPNYTYSWGWSLKQLKGDEMNLSILCWVDMEDTGAYCEVISNIHDNPELLTEATP